METETGATSEGPSEGTTSTETPVPEETSTATSEESTEERATASSGDKVDLDSIPKELRSHVEKYAKKYEKEFKGTYTQKFQALSAKDKLLEQERAAIRQEREQWRTIATDVLKDPSKLEAYRQLYGVPKEASSPDSEEIPEHINTVGDFLAWQKKQNENLRQTVLSEAAQRVQTVTSTERWKVAIANSAKDKHFAKYQDFILQIAQRDPEIKAKWTGANESEILSAAHERMKEMLREDMEEVKARTLAEQVKKKAGATSVPSKTTPMVQQAAASKEDVIARVRARLGPSEAAI